MWTIATTASAKLITIHCIAQNRHHFYGTVKRNLSVFSSWASNDELGILRRGVFVSDNLIGIPPSSRVEHISASWAKRTVLDRKVVHSSQCQIAIVQPSRNTCINRCTWPTEDHPCLRYMQMYILSTSPL